MWIYDENGWPNFTWDAQNIEFELANLRQKQGRLLGYMASLGFDIRREASLCTLTRDVVYSSAIEGEHLNATEVRSSIARQLGVDIGGLLPKNRDVEGIVEMMLDATQGYDKPLTKDRLFAWHAALFPIGRSGMHWITVAGWRTASSGPMQVVSGRYGREKVHFEAPHADKLHKEMQQFLAWFESNELIDPVLKAGIAHLWFVTIHPFEDGNGRIARAIGDMALARADQTVERFYSLSSQIELERKDYYQMLEYQQRGTLNITPWLKWFIACMTRAIDTAEEHLEKTLFKAKLWDTLHKHHINTRQKLIINKMMDSNFQGYMNTSKYAKLAKCSSDTALRDITQLKALGILLQNDGSGRSTSYRITDTLPSD